MNPGFSVLRFTLDVTAEGKPTQKVQECGAYASVEAAFAVARTKAMQELQRARQRVLDPSPAEIFHLEDTEWGYDLRREHLIVTRFWVHDGQPAELGVGME